LLSEENPAYSSQTCPSCGFVHSNNRKGEKFYCQHCGKEGNADFFASLNLKQRFYENDITLFTPYREVKKILMSKFEASVESVQPGLVSRKIVK